MNWFSFRIRTLLAITLFVAIAVYFWPKRDPNAPDPIWRETLLEGFEPLGNIPEIGIATKQKDQVTVTATSNGVTTLVYRGISPDQISLYQEVWTGTVWKKDAETVDGVCEGFHEIAPGESVNLTIEFWDLGEPVRMLGKFTEKGTDRAGMVVLSLKEDVD